ncbi:MAG: magnesium transporter [Oligoflexales bacterium]
MSTTDRPEVDVHEVLEWLEARNFKRLRGYIKKLDAPDIAECFKDLDIKFSIVLFRLVPKPKRVDVFSYLNFDRQEEMLDRLPDIVVENLLNQMEPADRTRLLEELDEAIRIKLIAKLSKKEKAMAKKLLSYPEGSVGRLMSPEFISLKQDMKADEALGYLRWTSGGFPESALHHLFVVDAEKKLLGYVSLASLVIADPASTLVKDLMDTPQPFLNANENEDAAADFFRKYDTPYIPIVNESEHLVGIVEAEAAFDVAEDEATEDLQQFGGHASLEDSYFQTSTFTLIRKRAGWLALLFTGSMFTANALEHFDRTIQAMSVLVFFLPLIVSSGGNSGSQAASLMIRSLAIKEISLGDWYKVLGREMIIGLSLGAILGLLGFLRAYIGSQSTVTAIIVSSSLIGVVTFGSIVGSMLPLLLKSVKLDPAVSSSPAIASVVDIVGIFIFFNIATRVLGSIIGSK